MSIDWEQLWTTKVAPKLLQQDDHLLFVGALTKAGYGMIRARSFGRYGENVYVHRLALFRQNKEWPKVTRHFCSYRNCIAHIKAGTQQENMHDLIRSGKHNLIKPLGRFKPCE